MQVTAPDVLLFFFKSSPATGEVTLLITLTFDKDVYSVLDDVQLSAALSDILITAGEELEVPFTILSLLDRLGKK